MSSHPNTLINTMELLGYGLEDILPAFPSRDTAYVDQMLRDNGLALSRPVIPYGLLGINPCQTEHFNITVEGFRSVGRGWQQELVHSLSVIPHTTSATPNFL